MPDAVDLIAALGGELITYTPHGGTAKSFKALIEREPLQPEQAGGYRYQVNELVVHVPRDATNGVLTVQEGKDRMSFKRHVSDTAAREYVVMKIQQEDVGFVSSDGGMFVLVVEGA